jgi:hypothetical protein
MGIELARIRLRGIYAAVAGAMLLIGVPALESVTLAANGYLVVVAATARSGDFQPLLVWIATHSGLDGGFRLFVLVPFLLSIMLPHAIIRVLWPGEPSVASHIALWTGRIGFGCFALAVMMGIVSSKSAAADYASATTPQSRAAVATGFAQAFAAQNLIAHVLGGVLVAVALGIIAARIVRRGGLPLVAGFLAVVAGVMLLVTALEYLAGPARVETSTSALSFAALALWLIATGIGLWQKRALPAAAETAKPAPQSQPQGESEPASAAHEPAPPA